MEIKPINNTSFGNKPKTKLMEHVKETLTKDDDFLLKQYYKEIKDIKPLSKKEEKKLSMELRLGGEIADRAREKLMMSVLPNIVNIAKQLANHGLSLGDLIQEGNLALAELIQTLDYDGDNKFLNTVYKHIYYNMARAINNKSRTIRLPNDVWELLVRIQKTNILKTPRKWTPPDIKKIAEKLGEKESLIILALKSYQPIENIDDDNIINKLSFDKNDRGKDDVQIYVDNQLLKEKLNLYLRILSPKQRDVIIKRFGLDGKGERTLQSIASTRNCTKEAIRILEEKALGKLCNKKHFLGKRLGLQEFLD